MNKINLFIIGLLLATTMACKEDVQELSIEEKQIQMLTGKWQLIEVTRDAESIEGYENFELLLSSTSKMITYTSINRPEFSPWESGGIMSFGDEPLSELIRDAGTKKETSLLYEVNENDLVISFNYQGSGFEGSRIHGVQGNWVFRFSK